MIDKEIWKQIFNQSLVYQVLIGTLVYYIVIVIVSDIAKRYEKEHWKKYFIVIYLVGSVLFFKTLDFLVFSAVMVLGFIFLVKRTKGE